MENALVAIICIALLLVGGAVVVETTLSTVDTVSTSWKEMETHNSEIVGTDIVLNGEADVVGTTVSVIIINQGREPLHDFSKWNVFLQYEEADGDHHIIEAVFYDGDEDPGEGEWAVTEIYIDAAGSIVEIYEPDILNPGEEMLIEMVVPAAEPIGAGTSFLIATATPNGVSTSRSYSA